MKIGDLKLFTVTVGSLQVDSNLWMAHAAV